MAGFVVQGHICHSKWEAKTSTADIQTVSKADLLTIFNMNHAYQLVLTLCIPVSHVIIKIFAY